MFLVWNDEMQIFWLWCNLWQLSYPLTKNIVEICQDNHTQGEATEYLEKISDVLRILTLNIAAKKKIKVNLKHLA